ncbi:MAG: flagellar basal-body rod protein FlgG [Myxococcota bacterium]
MRALYTAASGMTAQQLKIDNIANNLANVSTTGFKKGRGNFEDLLYQQMPTGQPSALLTRPANLSVGSGVRMVSMNRDFTTGNLAQTDNQLDIALGDRGFFVLEDQDGNALYTRAGSFSKNADGEIVSASGFRLSGVDAIPDDAERLTIAEDGTVSVTFRGETTETTIGTIRVVDFVNPAGLEALGGNMYIPTAASGESVEMYPEDGVEIYQGFLESSNVDVAEELVNMIVAQRAYELTSKVVQSADETLQVANNIKR